MCSGRVDLTLILRAFASGADGVFIGGCRLNECNYITQGNYHALNVTLLGKQILQHMGLNSDRLQIEFMSGGDGILFAEVVDAFVEQVKTLGPIGKGKEEDIEGDALNERLSSMAQLVPYIKIAKREKLAMRMHSEDDYEGYFTLEEVEALFRDVVSYYIEPSNCKACMTCLRRCPMDAIDGGKNLIHVIDQEKCIKCGTCLDACPTQFGAVRRIIGEPVPAPPMDRSISRNKHENKCSPDTLTL
jgi:F420-non-reducing hydrogenase iron-sulfur subunit